MKRNLLVSVFALFAWAASLQAGSLEDAYELMCEKMQSCAVKSIEVSDLPPEMRAMVLQSLEGACMGIQQQFSGITTAHPLYGSASACLKSMASLSCDEIENQGERTTPECARYEKVVGGES